MRAQVQSIREKLPWRACHRDQPAVAGTRRCLCRPRCGSARRTLPVFQSDSVLALRERLVDLPDDGPPLVVLTESAGATELGDDLLARFAHRRVFAIDPWQLVKERFKALKRRSASGSAPWLGGARAARRGAGGRLRAGPQRFLWMPRRLGGTCSRRLSEPGAASATRRRCLHGRWTTRPADKLNGLSDVVQTGLAEAVGASAGRVARVIFECAVRFGQPGGVRRPRGARPLPSRRRRATRRAAKATGKLEALLGLPELDTELARDMGRRGRAGGAAPVASPWSAERRSDLGGRAQPPTR